jgi:AcrR family transcriptional regulator
MSSLKRPRKILDRTVYNTNWVPRPPLHSEAAILDAARTLVLERGARATTLNGIAGTSGVPKGSIYHRFDSLDDLLAEMWMRAVRRSQQAFIDALAEPDPVQAAVAAALTLHDFAAGETADARLLASVRREDLIESVDSPRLRRELARLNRPLELALGALARRLFGRARREDLERVVFATVDIPLGATRRHLISGTPLPRGLRDQIAAATRAALGS